MPVMQFIDSSLFNPVYNNKLPIVQTPTIDAICKELFYAIKSNEPIFVYGDYDMDGFCAAKVWDDVLTTLYSVPVKHFIYGRRQHSIDPDIILQAKNSGARIVIICDSGSSLGDHEIVSRLRLNGHIPIVIDHHNWDGDYFESAKHNLIFNSHEERSIFGGSEISGAYASLLVCARLCEHYFHHSLSYSAMVYALASMYSDIVDVSSAPGRALYNVVSMLAGQLTNPVLFDALNNYGYSMCKRFFSFQLAPKFNHCFRSGHYEPVNQAMLVHTRPEANRVAKMLAEVHIESKERANMLAPRFTREKFGNILLCTHEATDETRALHVRDYSGLIANIIAQEEKCLAVIAIHDNNEYQGSFRDFYNRNLLDTFRLFCDADGHDSAFGIKFTSIWDMRRHLAGLSEILETTIRKDYDVLSSSLAPTKEDIQALALYNEYMNIHPKVFLTHRVTRVQMLRTTKYYKLYDIGLPYGVFATMPVLEGSTILVEPRITKQVELYQVE